MKFSKLQETPKQGEVNMKNCSVNRCEKSFLLIGRVFIRARFFFILSKSKQKFLLSYGKFLHWETYLFKQKTCPIHKKMPFNVQCMTFITIRNDKKIVLCFGQDFLAF